METVYVLMKRANREIYVPEHDVENMQKLGYEIVTLLAPESCVCPEPPPESVPIPTLEDTKSKK